MPDPTATSSSDDLLSQIMQRVLAPPSSNVLTDVGQLLGGAAGGRANGRAQEASLLLGKGALDKSLYDASLNRYMTGVALPSVRANQAVTGDLMANVQDVTPTGPAWLKDHLVSFQGGKRPSALGPNARAAGATLSNIGASNIGKDVLPAVPKSPDLPQSGLLDQLLAGGGTAAGIAGALAKGGGSIDLGKAAAALKGLFGHGNTGPQAGTTLPDDFWANLERAMGSENGGPNVDPSQLPGYNDPMKEYNDWLARQGGNGDEGDTFDSWGDAF